MSACQARLSVCSLALALSMLAASGPAAQQPPVQTLCVLDFQRLGNDARADWLEGGLADMMIGAMHRASPYLVVERRHLKQILIEHGLAQHGLLDINTAVRGASLAKAQLLLLGSFGSDGDDLTVQVRLIRVSDQQVLAQATWTGRHNNVLAAPRALNEQLQTRLGSPVDYLRTEGIEGIFPTTIDVARSYYLGVRAFDEGRYPEALGHYLDAARAGDFHKAYPAVLEMYDLLGRSEHAVLFARDRARRLEEQGDLSGALEYYFAAAQTALDPLGDLTSTSELLTQLLHVVDSHERKTGEVAANKRAVLKRLDELRGAATHMEPGRILADRHIRHLIWTSEIDNELDRRAEEQARGGYAVFEDGKWIKRSVPPPSTLMWRIRARRTLARTLARSKNITSALDQYRALVDEYAFLEAVPAPRLSDSIKTEAHFMLLRHYTTTGQLIRDHPINRINKLNVVKTGMAFSRDFSLPTAPSVADARARVSSRGDGQGHEYFDFAAPAGQQIDSVRLKARVDGIAEFGISLPQSAGWPPQYSFSKRVEHFKFAGRDGYQRTIVLPSGTEFLSLGTSWGPGLYSNTWADLTRRKMYASNTGPDLVGWELSFALSPKSAVRIQPTGPAQPAPAAQAMMNRYAPGWSRGYVVRDTETSFYTGEPRLDVYAEDWLVFSMDGDIRIFQQRDPRVEVALPVTINTRAREHDASLVRTHNGGYALLWSRGTSRKNADRFVAFSTDLLQWETPQRLVFEAPSDDTRYTYAQLEPLERTYNVAAVRNGYAMLLAQGLVCLSKDLRHWSSPRKALPQDLDRNRLIKGQDGSVWAVYETSSRELQPYTEDDRLHGYFVTGGKAYRHVTELHVSRSRDGIAWQDAGKVVVAGRPSALWAFPIGDKQIGVAAGFNNVSVRWFAATEGRGLMAMDSRLQLWQQPEETACFVQAETLTCIRPLFDGDGQRPMLLASSTGTLW